MAITDQQPQPVPQNQLIKAGDQVERGRSVTNRFECTQGG